MDHSSKLYRQRSYGCTPFDVGSWCHNGRVRAAGFARAFEDGDYEEDDKFEPPYYQPVGRAPSAAGAGFRGLWRRIVREKRWNMRPSRNHATGAAAYDEFTYAQNFDEGSAWDDDSSQRTCRGRSRRGSPCRRGPFRGRGDGLGYKIS